MEWWQAAILGVVEGLTEFLPVSSTGHLLIAERLLGVESGLVANAYVIAVQAGAIVAVLGLYAPQVRRMLMGLLGRDANGARLARNLVVAFLPAAITGLLLDKFIEEHLFGAWPVVAAWLVGGVAILLFTRLTRGRAGTVTALDLGAGQALVIGLCQCLALWPGTSRSLVTIIGGVLCGLSLGAAVEFSFLLGLLTLGAATSYKLLQHGAAMLAAFGPFTVAIGFVTAALSAVVAVRWMVGYLSRHSMNVFAFWRIGLALLVGALIAGGQL